jgi:hypothetical protein
MSDGLHGLGPALVNFVAATATQSGEHITALHWHFAERLVLEGGFPPEYIIPRPPFRIDRKGRGDSAEYRLIYDPSAAKPGELTVLGGLKTKDVDVVIVAPGIGPVLAISVKGSLNAFRNLTNRMEEAAGDCTNLHMAYPALVYGFLHVIRANREGQVPNRNDIAILATGAVVEAIQRYHEAMSRLTGRKDLRDDVSRYEAVALALVEFGDGAAIVRNDYPLPLTALRFERFLADLLDRYDLRFVYSAPALRGTTARLEWVCDDPLKTMAADAGFQIRLR